MNDYLIKLFSMKALFCTQLHRHSCLSKGTQLKWKLPEKQYPQNGVYPE